MHLLTLVPIQGVHVDEVVVQFKLSLEAHDVVPEPNDQDVVVPEEARQVGVEHVTIGLQRYDFDSIFIKNVNIIGVKWFS